MGNAASFGIGTYQSISGGTQVGVGFSTQSFQLNHPYGGTYGGTYGFVLDTRIRAPTQVTYQPAPQIGMDGVGVPVVRGYPELTWSYSVLRPDYWYYLHNLYVQSARTQPAFQYLVLLQYPDPLGSGTLIQSLARMDPPRHGFRMVAHYADVSLKFTYVGQTQLLAGTPIVVLS